MEEVKIIGSKVLFEHPVVRIVVDWVEYEGHKQRLIYLDSTINAVATLGVTTDNEILLTRQYRHPVGQFIYDLPGGKLNPGEAPVDGARREFEEETGFAPQEIFELATYNQFPGMLRAYTHIYFARRLVRTQQKLDEGEYLDVVSWPIQKVLDGVLGGQFIDGSVQLALLMALQKKLIAL